MAILIRGTLLQRSRVIFLHFFIYIILYLLFGQKYYTENENYQRQQVPSRCQHPLPLSSASEWTKSPDCKEFDEIIVLRENISLIRENIILKHHSYFQAAPLYLVLTIPATRTARTRTSASPPTPVTATTRSTSSSTPA